MPTVTEMTHDEYKARTRKVQAALAEQGCCALLLTSEDNIHYLTGFKSPVWNNLTRPRYLIVPASSEPFLISSANYVVIIEETTWITDIRTWISPNPEDDGISLVIDGLKSCGGSTNKIAAELGPQSRITMPAGDFIRIQKAFGDVPFVDGHTLLMMHRAVKSPGEIERIQVAATATSQALRELPNVAHAGQSLYELAQGLKVRIIEFGAEDVPYIIAASGQGGYPCVNLAPDRRPLQSRDVFVFDVAARYDGYYCDFDRDFVVGEPIADVRSQHRRLWDATAAGIEAVKPGLRMSDVWRTMADVLGVEQVRRTGIGRMGHSVGLRMCEEPSIGENDHTIIRENMVLTLEPGIILKEAAKTQRDKRIMVHEENLLVTANGAKLISERTPQDIPVVRD
jgi:Xaa-Pro aminopeptidase